MNTVVSHHINSQIHMPTENLSPVLVVCDIADQEAKNVILNYLYDSGYTSVTLATSTDCKNNQIKTLLEEDLKDGFLSFVMFKENMLRHYFNAVDATDFSIYVVAAASAV